MKYDAKAQRHHKPQVQASQGRRDPSTEESGVMRTVPSLRSLPNPLEARAPCAQAFVRTAPWLLIARRALSEAPNCDPALPPNLHCACAGVSLRVVLCAPRCSLGGELCPPAIGVCNAVPAQKQPRPGSRGRVRPPGRKSDSRVLTGVEPRGAGERGGSSSDDNNMAMTRWPSKTAQQNEKVSGVLT